MVENRNLKNVRQIFINLSKAYQLLMKRGICTFNPYDGVADDIKIKGAQGKTQSEIEIDDNDILNQSKAYTWLEAQEILDYFQNRKRICHYYNFLKFKLLTGCRTGEAIAFMFDDIFWDKQEIGIRRTYDIRTKKLFPLKNSKEGAEITRRFPMPKDSELWNLLKSISEGKANEIVFKSKTGKILSADSFSRAWRGLPSKGYIGAIPELIKQGKLTKYLPPYNTRHTHITHQIFDLGKDEKIVSALCGHGEFVSQKHYQDITERAMQFHPDLSANDLSSQKSEIDLLKEQIELMKATIEQLTNK